MVDDDFLDDMNRIFSAITVLETYRKDIPTLPGCNDACYFTPDFLIRGLRSFVAAAMAKE